MNARRVNTVLWSLAAACAAAAVAVLALGIFVPLAPPAVALQNDDPSLASPDDRRVSAATRPSTATSAAGTMPPLASFASIWSAPLRRLNLQGPAGQSGMSSPRAAPAAPAATAVVVAPLTLVGTIGDSLALLRRADGVVEVREVGDEIAGAIVLAVRRSQVDLRINGRAVTLDRPAVAQQAPGVDPPNDAALPSPESAHAPAASVPEP